MPRGDSNKKVANGLVAASCAAVLAVYTAGYTRTRSAADRLDARAIERRASASVALPPTPSPGREVKRATPDKPREIAAASKPAVTKVPEAAVAPSTPVPVEVAPITPPVAIAAPAVPVAEPKKAEPAKPNLPPWKDGTFLGWGSSRHGDIQAEVVIADGRIVSATIAECKTMYSCYVIEKLPPEVAQRQSPDVDTVSGASESSDAFYWAVMDALTQAK